MADTNRRINIWINDKEVENSFKGISDSMRKAKNELAHMTIGSKEYIEQTQKIRMLQGAMDKHREAQGLIANGWRKVLQEYKTMTLSMISSNVLTGMLEKITSFFPTIIEKFSNYEKGFSDTLTNMTKADIDMYSARMQQGTKDIAQLGITVDDTNKSLFDAVSAGIPAGESIEFLNQAARLSIGGVTTLSTATDGLTTVMNAYNLSTDKAAEISDSFFTAQKYGKTTVSQLANEVGKVIPIAKSAGISYQEILSAVSALTLGGISTSESVTYLKSAIGGLVKPSKEAEAVLRQFGVPVGATELKAKGLGYTLQALNEMIKQNPDAVAKAIPSVEGLTAVLTMSGEGLEQYDSILQQVQTDIGLNSSLSQAYEIKQATLAQTMAKVKGQVEVLMINLGEKLAPAFTKVISTVGSLTSWLMKATTFVVTHAQAIGFLLKMVATIAVSIISYTAALKLSTFWEQRSVAVSLLQNAIFKVRLFLVTANTAATQLLAAAKALLTGNITAASVAMQRFNMVTKLSPVGLLIGVITAAAAAYILFSKTVTDAEKAQKLINDVSAEAQKHIVGQKNELQYLLSIAQDETKSKVERKKAIEELNKISPEYLGNLTLDKINTDEARKAIENYIVILEKKAKAQAIQQKLVEIEQKLIDVQVNGDGAEVSYWDAAVNGIMSFGNAQQAVQKNVESSIKNQLTLENQLLKDKQVLLDMLKTEGLLTTENVVDPVKKTPNIIPGGATQEEIDKQKKLFDEYEKAYTNLRNKVGDLNGELSTSTISAEDKELRENTKKWKEELVFFEEAIADFEKTYSGDDKVLKLEKYYKKTSDLGVYYLAKEKEITKKYADEKLKAQKEVEDKFADFLNKQAGIELSDFEKKKQEKIQQLKDFLQTLEKSGLATSEIYKKISAEITNINNSKEDTVLFGLTQEKFDKLKKKIEKVISAIKNVKTAFESYNDFRKNAEDNELKRSEDKNTREKEFLDKRLQLGIISQEEYNNKVAKMDVELDVKKRRVQHEQAVRDKRMRLFEIALNTASAVVEALPSVPLSIAAGVLGGIQFAFAAAQPVPFAKGGAVDKPTYAMIGEAGREYIFNNKMINDPVTGPQLDYLLGVQSGKLSRPNNPNMDKIRAGVSSDNQSNGATYITQTIDNKEISALRKDISLMTKEVSNLKYIKSVISSQQLKDHEEDKQLLKMYSSI